MEGGRPRKPRALRVLDGSAKHDPQRENNREPIPSKGDIRPPAGMTKEGRAAWARLAPDLIAKELLTPWDVDAFGMFCEALAIAWRCIPEARMPGEPGAQSPMSRYREAVQICATLGCRFGWTPSDRQKLVVGGQGADPKERLLS